MIWNYVLTKARSYVKFATVKDLIHKYSINSFIGRSNSKDIKAERVRTLITQILTIKGWFRIATRGALGKEASFISNNHLPNTHCPSFNVIKNYD